ncbi:DUF2147 domain-containing protein [Pseudoalteromonas sp. SWN166]|uniref:DUF2147 domain-containing protein n=1 Tax=Pseudoalteromonas sp. SWN166 TaxID=2792061 RepID=UPI0018CD29EC|nr:DUF2147 domain-containing protein [Pseudoalteromonas sp. SWN166]MBH0036933.1 DUF2147 domain-containing protein [Pseudoalteromonas sp. SWN166]
MKKLNKTALLSTLAATIFASQSAFAAISPVGLWKTIDEDTNQAKSYVRITQTDGVLSGTVDKIIDPTKQNDICSKCDDELKDQPILGMTIIKDVKAQNDGIWGDGEILDPTNGKTYTLQLTPQEEGKKLEVRGYISFFYRNQYWVRVE